MKHVLFTYNLIDSDKTKHLIRSNQRYPIQTFSYNFLFFFHNLLKTRNPCKCRKSNKKTFFPHTLFAAFDSSLPKPTSSHTQRQRERKRESKCGCEEMLHMEREMSVSCTPSKNPAALQFLNPLPSNLRVLTYTYIYILISVFKILAIWEKIANF